MKTEGYANGAQDLLNLAYDYGTQNNGQIRKITYNTSPGVEEPTKTQNYEYDAWARLKKAYTTDLAQAGTWRLEWDYDRFGNRRNQTWGLMPEGFSGADWHSPDTGQFALMPQQVLGLQIECLIRHGWPHGPLSFVPSMDPEAFAAWLSGLTTLGEGGDVEGPQPGSGWCPGCPRPPLGPRH